MEQLKQTYCRYDMVCDNPKGDGVEIVHMPEFFSTKPDIETSLAHVHPFYEIVWFSKGAGTHTVDFADYPVADNTLFFISPGQVHSFDGNHHCQGMVIKICAHLIDDAPEADSVLLKYNVFGAYDSVPFRRITPRCAEIIAGIASKLEQETLHTGHIGHRDYMQALVKMMIIQIERCQDERSAPVFTPARSAHRTFLAFRREIERNYRTTHTVKEYADRLGVSTKSLTNHVAECSDFSPLEMINNRITLEAKRMLRYSDMMVKEIAAAVGFEDPSYFIKFFKRMAKCSPAEYRTPQ